MEGPATAGTEVEAAETGDSDEKRGRKRAGRGMKTAKRTWTGSIDGNGKKGEERNGVEAVMVGWPQAGRGQGVCGGSNEDRGGQCRTVDRVCMCVSEGGGEKVGTGVRAAKGTEGWMQRGRKVKSRNGVDS